MMLEISKIMMNYEVDDISLTQIEQIGWQICSDKNNVYQKGYWLDISKDTEYSDIIYTSGYVETNNSMNIKIPEEIIELHSFEKYYTRVKVATNIGDTDWKEISFITGAIKNNEWCAQFITLEKEEHKNESKSFYARKGFDVQKKIKEAYVGATALGLYHLIINGKKVGNDMLTPGWTSYNKHLQYQVYDVTEYLAKETESKNVIGGIVGAGWYKGDMGFMRQRNHYGNIAAFSCQLHIVYEDGTDEIIITDDTWESEWGPIVFSEIYDGETYDARLEIEKWCEKNCLYQEWKKVNIVKIDSNILRVQNGCKVKEITEVLPQKLITTRKNEKVINFGQNLTGWVRFKTYGKKDAEIVLRFFEVLDAEGNVYLDNLRSAKQTIRYICKDNGEIVFQPSFTFQGFQYMEILEYPSEIGLDDFKAYAVHSDMKKTGTFECSNKEVNQLQHNIEWGMKGNFIDVPTDCPQRDERLGWTGDAQIFCRTASYLMNTNTFYRKWLRDLKADQTEEGGVPHVVPDILIGKSQEDRLMKDGEHSAAAWADAAIIIPWTMYLVYGDKNVIIEQYDSMKKWIGFMQKHSENNIWNYKLQFGDWVALDAEEGSYFGATPNDLTCTAFYAYVVQLFAKMAKVIGVEADYVKYTKLYNSIVKTYQNTFFDAAGHIVAKTQTAQIISLYFNLVPEKFIKTVASDLVELLNKENGHLVTGFAGTPYFCHVLSKTGYVKEAYELLLKEDFPSWLYQVKQGATTIWEHWDGKKPDGTMWSADMNSFNHYAYGAVGDWLYRVVVGIEVDENNPGYSNIILSPEVHNSFDYAKGTFESIYGEIVSHWMLKENEVCLKVKIPPNTTADLILKNVESIIKSEDLQFSIEKGEYRAKMQSGSYEIVYKIV